VSDNPRFYEIPASGQCRSAPAAQRNREPIRTVLEQWLPASGLVLEVASGTGEHAVYFAEHFPRLEWQPSDVHPDAIQSIAARCRASGLANLRDPAELDASSPVWPIAAADALLSINMVHISPWEAALGLLDGAARVLGPGSPLIMYGPWIRDGVPTAPSNLDFDRDLRRRNPAWGLRRVEDFSAVAALRGLELVDTRAMPANNLMLLLRRC
jgi:SAM-dependent methyltransferase